MATGEPSATHAVVAGRSRFVNALRTTGESAHVTGAGTMDAITLRVQSAEAWSAIRVDAALTSGVREVKLAAMARLLPDATDPDAYVVKLHGALIDDERVTLRDAGATDGSTLLLVLRRRRPVR